MSIAAPASGAVSFRTLFGGIFLVAFATLLFELALIRILSFTIWHHFGYVVISTALLGFGASGTFLAIRPALGARNLRTVLTACSWLSAATVLAMLIFVAAAPLHPMSLLNEPGQAALFVGYQLGAAIPFFFSGLVVSLSLRQGAQRVDRLYFWDLLGAGLGCLAAVALMNLLSPPGAAVISAAIFGLAACVYAPGVSARALGLGGVLLLAISATQAHRVEFTPARSKQYAMQRAHGSEPVFSRWTALFRTDVLEHKSGRLPGTLWGLSRRAPASLVRPRFHVSHDGTAGAGIYDLRESSKLDYVDYHILRAPYLVANPDPRVLVIGVGGGRDILVALQLGASHVTGVELDPVSVELIRDEMNDVSAGFFRGSNIDLVAAEGRNFIRSAQASFDVIQLTGVDTLSAINSGAYILAENYLYTVEAFHDYLDHLEPGGVLSFAMANLDPRNPRAAGRIVSVAHEALVERGVERPGAHIVVVNSGTLYAEVMIRTEPWTSDQLDILGLDARFNGFSPLHMGERGGTPVFEKLAGARGHDRERFLAQTRYRLGATTDNSPFFLSFFRWNDLFEPGRLTPSHSSALGQIVLGMLLVSLSVLAAVFILLPLIVFGVRGGHGSGTARLGVMVYFVAVGLGFMLFEISLIQRFVLFLGYPTYSLSVTLCSLLVFLGWGSYLSRFWVDRYRTVLPIGVACIAILALFYVFALPSVQSLFFGTSLAVRAVVTAAVLAPLGLVMGAFFPLGIRIADDIHPDLVPWAWGINGCASVTAGVLAVVLALSFGFALVWTLSVVIYALGVAALLAMTRRPE